MGVLEPAEQPVPGDAQNTSPGDRPDRVVRSAFTGTCPAGQQPEGLPAVGVAVVGLVALLQVLAPEIDAPDPGVGPVVPVEDERPSESLPGLVQQPGAGLFVVLEGGELSGGQEHGRPHARRPGLGGGPGEEGAERAETLPRASRLGLVTVAEAQNVVLEDAQPEVGPLPR